LPLYCLSVLVKLAKVVKVKVNKLIAQESAMIAAIYARKSTEQLGICDEEKSISRQIEHARAYAARKGWAIAEDQVFTKGMANQGRDTTHQSPTPDDVRLLCPIC
jgi:hypothetical protein